MPASRQSDRHCPEQQLPFVAVARSAHATAGEPFVFVNVGSNKGYAVASAVARFGGSSALAAVSNAAWYQAIREYFALNGVKDEAALGRLGWGGSGNTMCGMCCACRGHLCAPSHRVW